MKSIQDNVTVRGNITRFYIVVETEVVDSAQNDPDERYSERLVGCFIHHGTAKSFAMHMDANKASENTMYYIAEHVERQRLISNKPKAARNSLG